MFRERLHINKVESDQGRHLASTSGSTALSHTMHLNTCEQRNNVCVKIPFHYLLLCTLVKIKTNIFLSSGFSKPKPQSPFLFPMDLTQQRTLLKHKRRLLPCLPTLELLSLRKPGLTGKKGADQASYYRSNWEDFQRLM